MPQVRGELDHLLQWVVVVVAIPKQQRSHREGMPQIVDARATPMLVEGLPLAQADS